ncbi:MAG: VOC family protein [Chitinivibrionales bacterium]
MKRKNNLIGKEVVSKKGKQPQLSNLITGMGPRLNVITIGVNNLERSLAFYREGLGLPSKGIFGTEFQGDEKKPSGAVAFFELHGGLILALYPRADLAKDANLPDGTPNATEFSIGYAVHNRDEVDALLSIAKAAGATLTDKAHDRPWGIYSGYFQDPDGHLWEILWNPAFKFDD